MCEFKEGDGKGSIQMTSTSMMETLEKCQRQVDEQVKSCPGCATWKSRSAQDQQKAWSSQNWGMEGWNE